LVQGELACVQGKLFVVFELCFGGLRSFLEPCFVSDVCRGKPLGSLVDPQSQDRRTEDGAATVPDRSDRWVPV
jgi:arginine/lysine/ornithine decarboxylase